MGIEWANILQKTILVYFIPQKKTEVSHTEEELILSTMREGSSSKNFEEEFPEENHDLLSHYPSICLAFKYSRYPLGI